MITNVVNGKKYIGSTISLRYRASQHFTKLSDNCHSNKHLQYAWNKYGAHSFQFDILEIVVRDEKLLFEKEQAWIDFFQSFLRENGYNRSSIASRPSNTGRKWSESERAARKLSKRRVMPKQSEETVKKRLEGIKKKREFLKSQGIMPWWGGRKGELSNSPSAILKREKRTLKNGV